MPSLDRTIAGLSCRDVLAGLADYVNGELPDSEVDRIHQHLRGCDHCERFGGAYGKLVKQLRARLSEQPDSDRAISSRVNAYMNQIWTNEGA